MNTCLICINSSRSAIGDSFKDICNSLYDKPNIFVIKSNSYEDKEFKTASNKLLNLEFNKGKLSSYLNVKKWLEIKRFIRDNQIQHLFFYSDNPANIIFQTINLKQKYSFWWHDPVPHSGVSNKKVYLYSFATRKLLQNPENIFVASNSLKNMACNLNFNYDTAKLKVLELPFIGDLVKNGEKIKYEDRQYDFIFFGRIEEYKGLDILYKAIKKLKKDKYSFSALIVGSGEINRYFPEDDLEEVKIVNRYVENEELSEFISDSRVAIFPYKDSTGTQAVQTSLFFECQIIATDTGSFKEYLSFGNSKIGKVIEPNNVDELYESMKEYLNRKHYSYDITEIEKRFSVNDFSERLYNIIN